MICPTVGQRSNKDRSARAHRLDGVFEEIRKDAFHAGALHGAFQIFRHLGCELDAPGIGCRASTLDQAAAITSRKLHISLPLGFAPRDIKKLLEHVLNTTRSPIDVSGQAPGLFLRQIAVHEHFSSCVNRRQRVAKIVDDGRRKLADGGDPFLTDQFMASQLDRVTHAAKSFGQASQFILAAHLDFIIEILFGDLARRTVQLRYRLHNLASHQVSYRQCRYQREQPKPEDLAAKSGQSLPRSAERAQNE